MSVEKAISFDELSKEKKLRFEELTEEYSMILQEINLFIEVNKLDYDEAWDITNQRYDSDMSYAPSED